MGEWRIKQRPEGKYLIYEQPTSTWGYPRRIAFTEGDVAKLIMFLQACGETWKREPEPACTASPPA